MAVSITWGVQLWELWGSFKRGLGVGQGKFRADRYEKYMAVFIS